MYITSCGFIRFYTGFPYVLDCFFKNWFLNCLPKNKFLTVFPHYTYSANSLLLNNIK